jgi:alpha-galactosidase
LSYLGLQGRYEVRDLWRQEKIGTYSDKLEFEIPHHGVMLVKITEK